jgi:hypothetical protein
MPVRADGDCFFRSLGMRFPELGTPAQIRAELAAHYLALTAGPRP